MAATKKRMGGMKLSDFGGQTASVQPEPAPEVELTTIEEPLFSRSQRQNNQSR